MKVWLSANRDALALSIYDANASNGHDAISDLIAIKAAMGAANHKKGAQIITETETESMGMSACTLSRRDFIETSASATTNGCTVERLPSERCTERGTL